MHFNPGGPRESTLKRWRSEGLPEEVNWFECLCREIDVDFTELRSRQERIDPVVSFKMMPEFEEKVLEHKNGHYLVQDWQGAVVEIADNFDVTYLRYAKDFVTRKYLKFPVENAKDWDEMKKRYNPDADILRSFLGRATGHIVFDSILFNEDMAYKEKSMISPAMVKKFLMPVWSVWAEKIKESGCKVVMIDSDGYIGELIPLWIESGANACWPIEVAGGGDIVKYRKLYGKKMAYGGRIAKRAMAKGGKVMEQEVYRVVPPLLKDGGYLPGCDHGVPPDISWQDFVEYSRLLAKLQGWL